MSTYLRKAVINAALRGQAFPAIAGEYLALFTGDPTADGSGPEVSTIDTGYIRQAVSFAAPVTGVTEEAVDNDAAVTFPKATGNQGNLSYWGVFDAVAGGNLLYYGELVDPTTGDPTITTVNNNDQFVVDVGALNISHV